MPADEYELARLQGYQQALDDVQEWLTYRVSQGIGLWQRVILATDLADGTWKTAEPLKGLRERDVLTRQAEKLSRRGIPAEAMTDKVRAFVEQERARRQRERDDHQAQVNRILRDRYGMDAPEPAPAPGSRTVDELPTIKPPGGPGDA